MGKVFSIASKPFREFNIESRAHKVISKGKPTPAPKYKSDELDYERILKGYFFYYLSNFKSDCLVFRISQCIPRVSKKR